MNDQITVCFPQKRSLGSLYTAEEQFPHQRKWVGEARGKVAISCPAGRMLGVALGGFGWEALAEADTAELARLRSIDLSTAQFNDKTLRSTTGALSELAEMRLDFLKFGDSELVSLRDFPLLKTLWLTGTQVSDGGMPHLGELRALINLVLKNTKVTDGGMESLAKLSLHSLTLPAQLSDAGVRALSALSTLKRLDLSFTAITNECLQFIAQMPAIEELYLNDTAITDQGLAHLADIKTLKTLFLSGTKVSDASLTQFEQMTSLEHLELRDTGVTEIAIARLRTKLPNCAIFGG
jgi:Leucine-rich repeat (LRR) protein